VHKKSVDVEAFFKYSITCDHDNNDNNLNNHNNLNNRHITGRRTDTAGSFLHSLLGPFSLNPRQGWKIEAQFLRPRHMIVIGNHCCNKYVRNNNDNNSNNLNNRNNKDCPLGIQTDAII
jgi:hypothetical protein